MAEPTDRRREIRRTAVIIGFLLLFVLLVVAFRGVLVPFLVAMFLAYLVEPLVERMARLRVGPVRLGRGGSLMAVYLVLAGLLVLAGFGLVPRVARQLESLTRSAPEAFRTLRDDWAPRLQESLDRFVGGPEETPPAGESAEAAPPPPETTVHEPAPLPILVGVPDPESGAYVWETRSPSGESAPREPPSSVAGILDRLIEEAQAHFLDGIELVTAVVRGVVGFVYSVVLILMLTAFFVMERGKIREFFDGLPPERYRAHYEKAVRVVDAGLSGVVRGQILVCLVNGFLTWIGLAILGIPYALLLGAVATVLSLVPIFGTIISSVPIVAIALFKGFGFGVAALVWIVIIHLIEANVINPRIIGSTAKLHPIVIIFALLAGEHAFGVVGALLAVPAASILVSMFRYARAMTEAEKKGEPAPEPTTG
jgi:predicted PurR-regulated permease PerM